MSWNESDGSAIVSGICNADQTLGRSQKFPYTDDYTNAAGLKVIAELVRADVGRRKTAFPRLMPMEQLLISSALDCNENSNPQYNGR